MSASARVQNISEDWYLSREHLAFGHIQETAFSFIGVSAKMSAINNYCHDVIFVDDLLHQARINTSQLMILIRTVAVSHTIRKRA